jgi:hypothetical protein
MEQPQDASRRGEGEAVVGQEATLLGTGETAQAGHIQTREVEFGAVVGDEDHLVGPVQFEARASAMGFLNRVGCNLFGSEEPIGGVELVRVGELVRERALGSSEELLGESHEPGGATLVAEFGTGEVILRETRSGLEWRIHERSSEPNPT